MKYYIVSGEASGDLHGSNLMAAIKELDPKAEFRAWGGDRMEAEGAELVEHYRNLAFMGFVEVVSNLRTILGFIEECKKDIAAWRPDVVILIDYPAFNLRVAPFLKKNGIRNVYYISPQLWAWKEGRVKKIKRFVDQMLVILPFEKDFYAKHGYEVEFVGHPLLDELKRLGSLEKVIETEKPILALLPGSRKQEIRNMLPYYLEAASEFDQFKIVVAGAPGQSESIYREIGKGYDFDFVSGRTYELLSQAHIALVTSGTATLETALIGVPQVVSYRGNWLSFQIGRRLVKVNYISLVNLVMGREVVKELVQDDLNPENLKEQIKLLSSPEKRQELENNYAELREKLGGSGASMNAAKAIISGLTSNESR